MSIRLKISFIAVIMILSCCGIAAADEQAGCGDMKFMRLRPGAAKNADDGLEYEIKGELFNRSKTALPSIKIHADGQKLISAGEAELKDLKPKEKKEFSITVTLGNKSAQGAKVPVRLSADAGDGCKISDQVALDYYDSTGTLFFIPGFHFDPIWWNTQQHFLESYTKDSGKREAFELINDYLDVSAKDPDYRFMLAEQDYLKPFTIVYPDRVGEMRKLIGEGRLELGGISYNEPQETLIGTEALIRNTLLGRKFQLQLGGKFGKYAWQADVFGHSPLYPMVIKGAGGEASAWARGPYHEWAPDRDLDSFPSEFYWVAPDGTELFTHFMSAHYSYGWMKMSRFRNGSGQNDIRNIFNDLSRTSLTGHILVPMIDDFAMPVEQLGDDLRQWNKENKYPLAVIGVPGMFFEEANRRVAEKDIHVPRESRDMNPVFPGCAVSFTDTKQANRSGENALVNAEKFGTVAGLLDSNYKYPAAAIDKAWRQLAFLSHHDGVTGSESDQVYLDLLAAWREVNEIGGAALAGAADTISGHIDTRPPAAVKNAKPIVVYNPLSWKRTDVVRFDLPGDIDSLSVYDSKGAEIPAQVITPPSGCPLETPCPKQIAFIAKEIPATGYSVYFVGEKGASGIFIGKTETTENGPVAIDNDVFSAKFDPAAGGTLVSLKEKSSGREFIPEGGMANEIVVYHEYPSLPGKGEGPWHLNPTGEKEYSSARPSIITVESGPVFTRVSAVDKTPVDADAAEKQKSSFVLLEKESKEIRDASNFIMRTFDLTQFTRKDGKVFVKFFDAFPNDGWGALAGKVKFTSTINGKPETIEFVPGKDGEKPYIVSDSDSRIDPGGRRFADASASWMYGFETDPGAAAALEIEIGNQYGIEASGDYREPETPYNRIQETYFYTGIDRVDFRTYILGYRGHDRLFRVQFTLETGGAAIPVYEIGNGAVGRNFGLDVDTAKESWTLGNTAYNWVDLSHVFFLQENDEKGSAVRRESVGIGEIVIGDTASRGDELFADRLVKAMAKKGATVTVTRASKRRCCDIKIDSVNAQFRVVIGNASTNSYMGEMEAKLGGGANSIKDNSATFMPKASVEIPAVLLATGNDGPDDGWVAGIEKEIETSRALSAKGTGGETAGMQPAPAGAALINRGTPSCIAYDDNGKYTLALSLLRGSSAWPSGLWLDPPRRKAPVNDNFEFENWDHEFWYSLYPHENSWYESKTVQRGWEFNMPLIARETEVHQGELPASGISFAEAKPENVILSAMKPAGIGAENTDSRHLSLRLYEDSGADANASIRLFKRVKGDPEQTDYTEESKAGEASVDGAALKLNVGAFHTTTVLTDVESAPAAGSNEVKPDELLERDMTGAAYSRYWRQNIGAAPLGGIPVSVILRPDEIKLDSDWAKYKVEVVVSNTTGAAPAKGKARLSLPTGVVFTGSLDYDVAANGYAVLPIELQSVAKDPPHNYSVAASIFDPAVPGQEVYDIARVSVKDNNEINTSLAGEWDFLMSPKSWQPGKPKSGTWLKIKLPGYWEKQFYNYDGKAVYRREISIPDVAGLPLALDFTKGVDDSAEVFLNGEKACKDTPSQGANEAFTCGLGVVKPGKALLEILVNDLGGDGGINGDVLLKTERVNRMFEVSLVTPTVQLVQCGKSELRFLVVNHDSRDAHGVALIVSPPETWKWLPEKVEFDVPAHSEKEVRVPVSVPGGDPVFNTWILGKFLINGQLLYSEAANMVKRGK